MKTTLRELKEVISNYNKLTSNLDTDNLDTEVTILQVLDSNGIKDAVRALKTQDYKDYCLFLANVAESVLHLFEEKYPNDQRPRKCIEGIRLWYAGEISDKELDKLREDVSTAAAAYVGVSAAYAAYAAAYAAYVGVSVAYAGAAYAAYAADDY